MPDEVVQERIACPAAWQSLLAKGHTPQMIDKYSGRHGEDPGTYNVCIACSCGVKVEEPTWEQITLESWKTLINKCRAARKMEEIVKFPKAGVED